MRRLTKNKKAIFLLFFLGVFVIAPGTFAVVLETNWPESLTGTKLTETSDLTEMVKYFYEWGITLGGLAAFIVLLTAGFQYLTSAGNPGAMSEAKNRIFSAFLGLILLLSSWLILTTINPQLTGYNPPPGELSGGEFPTPDEEQISPTGAQCNYALVYPETNWGGSSVKVNLNESVAFSGKSIKSYFLKEKGDIEISCDTDCAWCSEIEECNGSSAGCHWNEGENQCYTWCNYGCACTTLLFSTGDCSGTGVNAPSDEKNFSNWTDISVKCVKLIPI